MTVSITDARTITSYLITIHPQNRFIIFSITQHGHSLEGVPMHFVCLFFIAIRMQTIIFAKMCLMFFDHYYRYQTLTFVYILCVWLEYIYIYYIYFCYCWPHKCQSDWVMYIVHIYMCLCEHGNEVGCVFCYGENIAFSHIDVDVISNRWLLRKYRKQYIVYIHKFGKLCKVTIFC